MLKPHIIAAFLKNLKGIALTEFNRSISKSLLMDMDRVLQNGEVIQVLQICIGGVSHLPRTATQVIRHGFAWLLNTLDLD